MRNDGFNFFEKPQDRDFSRSSTNLHTASVAGTHAFVGNPVKKTGAKRNGAYTFSGIAKKIVRAKRLGAFTFVLLILLIRGLVLGLQYFYSTDR